MLVYIKYMLFGKLELSVYLLEQFTQEEALRDLADQLEGVEYSILSIEVR